MNYAQRIASAHGRIRNKFGKDAAGEQLYLWHNNVQIPCYESTRRGRRDLMEAIVVKEETLSVIATKNLFTQVPIPGDDVKFGLTLATAQSLRIDTIATTTIRPFYELELMDPNKAVTAE